MSNWTQPIRERLKDFGRDSPRAPDETAVSIKLRVTGACFHREHAQFELMVRRADDSNRIKEEKVLRISPGGGVDRAAIEEGLTDAATRLLGAPATLEALKSKKLKAANSKAKSRGKKK